MTEFTLDIDEYAEGAILLTGLEDCIIGVVEEFGTAGRRILYDKRKIIENLMSNNPMTESEAEEYYDYNILGLYAGEQNAVFLDIFVTPKLKKDGSYEFLTKS